MSQIENPRSRKPVPASFALPLSEFEGQPCPYCTKPMTGKWHHPTRDHVHPRRLGGKLIGKNRLVVCFKCNNNKDGRSLVEFAEMLMLRRDPRWRYVMRLITTKKYAAMGRN